MSEITLRRPFYTGKTSLEIAQEKEIAMLKHRIRELEFFEPKTIGPQEIPTITDIKIDEISFIRYAESGAVYNPGTNSMEFTCWAGTPAKDRIWIQHFVQPDAFGGFNKVYAIGVAERLMEKVIHQFVQMHLKD